MATLTTALRQPSLLDPEAPPPGGLRRPGAPLGDPIGDPSAPAPRRETLEDRIAATWDALTASHAAACPLCGGDLAARYSAGARPVGGRCRSCGTEVS